MAKFGLDYPALKERHPGLIYCSLTGYGQTGPMADRAGHDINYLARSGLMAYSGRKETGPGLTGMQIADIAAGSNNSVIGILAAVIHRQQTGEGQYIDVAMTDGVMAFNAMVGAAYLADGRELEREGHLLNGGSLIRFLRNRRRPLSQLRRTGTPIFCRLLPGHRPSGPDTGDSGDHRPAPSKKRGSGNYSKPRPGKSGGEIFKNYDACLEPVLSLAEALSDPQAREREMVVELPLPGGGSVKQLAHPIKYSETAPEYRHIGVPAGTHTVDGFEGIGIYGRGYQTIRKNGALSIGRFPGRPYREVGHEVEPFESVHQTSAASCPPFSFFPYPSAKQFKLRRTSGNSSPGSNWGKPPFTAPPFMETARLGEIFMMKRNWWPPTRITPSAPYCESRTWPITARWRLSFLIGAPHESIRNREGSSMCPGAPPGNWECSAREGPGSVWKSWNGAPTKPDLTGPKADQANWNRLTPTSRLTGWPRD